MRVQILTRKLINPSSPTPCQLQSMKISAMDQLPPPTYVGIIFYYKANIKEDQDIERIGKQLEDSLSEILTIFYPFAGRFRKESLLVDCNDQGAEYVEARVSGELRQVLNGELQVQELNQFLQCPVESDTSPLVSVQFNMFLCGGMAIGMRFSHRIADGFTMTSFINEWAKASREGIGEVRFYPNFGLASFFPVREVPGMMKVSPAIKSGVKIETRSFVFDRAAISNLKEIARSGAPPGESGELKGRQPSRVEVVTALIWRALIKVAIARHGFLRPSLLSHAVDIRGKTSLPIPPNSCGNLFRQAVARFVPNESEMGLADFASLVKEAITSAVTDCAKATSYNDLFCTMTNSLRYLIQNFVHGEVNVYMVISWCRFPTYDVDFGWGPPTWVSSVHKTLQVINLIDTKDGGIEVWVSLDEKDMLLFQQEPEIVAFSASQADRHFCTP